MIVFPCALCNRALHTLPVASLYTCPCGAAYELREMNADGVPGLAILLFSDGSGTGPATPCAACGAEISLRPVPPLGLFFIAGQGLFFFHQGGQVCACCGSPVPVTIDEEGAPFWRALAGGAS